MYFFSKAPARQTTKTNNCNTFLPFLKSSRRFFCAENISKRQIVFGNFNYKQIFDSFLSNTTQKKDTAIVIGIFADNLKKNGIFWPENKPIKIADFGCANAKTGLGYIYSINKNINHSLGFEYFGIDTNSAYIQEADSIISSESLIKKHTLIEGDALDGNLREIKELKTELFDFIFISHTAYYLRNALAYRAFIVDVERLLSTRGIAIFLHEDSTSYFRATYNEDNFKKTSTPMLLEQSAQIVNTKFNQFISNRFTSKLQFPLLNAYLWEVMKLPEKYAQFAHVPNFTKTLELLAFIVQRDLHGIAKEGLLSDYIDDVREAISANDNCLYLKTHMQTLVEPKCVLRHKIAKSLEQTFEELIKQRKNNTDTNDYMHAAKSIVTI